MCAFYGNPRFVGIPVPVARIIAEYALFEQQITSNKFGRVTAVTSHLGTLVCRGLRYAALNHTIVGVMCVVASLYVFASLTFDNRVFVWGIDIDTQKVHNVAVLIQGKYTQIAAVDNSIYALDTRDRVWEITLRFPNGIYKCCENVAKMVVVGSQIVFYGFDNNIILRRDKGYSASSDSKSFAMPAHCTSTYAFTVIPDQGLVEARDIKTGNVLGAE